MVEQKLVKKTHRASFKPSRRQVLAGAGATVLAVYGASRLIKFAGVTPAENGYHVTGLVHLVGKSGYASKPVIADVLAGKLNAEEIALSFTNPAPNIVHKTLLTTLDIATGIARQTALDIQAGHSAFPLPDGRIICLPDPGRRAAVVDKDHNLITYLEPPEGMGYGGHAMLLPGDEYVVLPCKRYPSPTSFSDPGLLQIVRVKDLKIMDHKHAAGGWPHQLELLPDGEHFAVIYYGAVTRRAPKYNLVMDVQEPRLAIYRNDDQSLVRVIDLPNYDAATTHIAVDGKGRIYIQMMQFFLPSEEGFKHQFDVLKKNGFGPIALSVGETVNNTFYLPVPLLRLDVNTGKTEEVFFNPELAKHFLSSATNTQTGAVVFGCLGPGAAVSARADGTIICKDAFELGCTSVSGTANIPGTPYNMLCDIHRGFVLVHSETLEPIARYAGDFDEATHLYASAGSLS